MQEVKFNLSEGEPCRSICSKKCNSRWIANSFEQKDIPSNILCPYCGDLAFETIIGKCFEGEDIKYCPSCGLIFVCAEVHSQISNSCIAYTVKIMLRQRKEGKYFALIGEISDLANLILDPSWFWTCVSAKFTPTSSRKVKNLYQKSLSNLRTCD